MPSRSYTVQTGETIPLYTGSNLLTQLEQTLHAYPSNLWAVDSQVWELHKSRLEPILKRSGGVLHLVPSGEASKCRAEKERMETAAFAHGMARDGAIVAVGGGVVGDLAGYVAATYMRGIALIQVPTTIVSLVDSSIGGKTGIDVPEGKNLVGAFKHPAAIIGDLGFVDTLPDDVYRDGFAEVVKHGAIHDLRQLEAIAGGLDQWRSRDPAWLESFVLQSQMVKVDVVVSDTQETGLRQVLNFGHTLGHAIEKEANYKLSHGLCVAAGMVLESKLGEQLELTAAGTTEHLLGLLHKMQFPLNDLLFGFSPEQLVSATQLDKKVRSGAVNYVFLSEPGAVARTKSGGYAHPVEDADVLRTLQKI